MISYRKKHRLTPEAMEKIKRKTIEREGIAVVLVNQVTGEKTEFATQTDAGRFLSISRQDFKHALLRNSVLAKLYKVEQIVKNKDDNNVNIQSDTTSRKPNTNDFSKEMVSFLNGID